MNSLISDSATVDARANLADSVEVGPYCVIGPHVTIGPGTRLLSNVVIREGVTLGRYNVIHPGTVIGGEPQEHTVFRVEKLHHFCIIANHSSSLHRRSNK